MTTATANTVHDNTSSQDVLTTIIYNAIICGAMVFAFLVLRLGFKRIYEPKSNFDIVPPNERPQKLPQTPWGWIYTLLTRPSKDTIDQAGIDGYLFLRYLVVFGSVFLCGILTWIVLLPINIVKGKGEEGLDQLGISNVHGRGKYYGHVLISWAFYGMIMFVIYREMVFYTNLRSAVLVSPAYAGKLSARTVIFQTVPDKYLDERRIRKMFDGVKHVWIARAQKKLEHKVAQRQKLCSKLENAMCGLLRKAMKAKIKADAKGELIEPSDELVCYVPQHKWPRMRKRPIIGHKVDVLNYCEEQIPLLNKEISALQADYRSSKPWNSVAVEFVNQWYAQQALQQDPYDQPLYFLPKQIGAEPEDIYWPNMRMFWWERLIRSFGASAFICVLVIFWAIPSAFVGMISNLTYLTNKIHFLRFIYKMPSQLLGIVTSLLPTILMSLLMLLLPAIIRTMAKISGCASVQAIEYYTQQGYFAFQVIQVFLVTTVASSVTSIITQIMQKPESAMVLLSSNLPKCSNFFISYVLFQGFSIAGGALLQIATFITFYLLGAFLDNTPRKKWNRFNDLGIYAWGTTFPIYTNLVVITLAYSIISPIILLFAAASFLILYICYQNNENYVFTKAPDGLGMYYVRALFQTMVGIYLGEVCLLGLFAVSKAWGPAILEIILLLVTVFFHIHMNAAYDPKLGVIPNTVMKPLDGKSDTISWRSPKSAKNDITTLPSANVGVPLLIENDHERKSTAPANFIVRFFWPNTYLSFTEVRKMIPDSFNELPEESEKSQLHAYDYSVVSEKCPKIWIPRDPMGLSEKFKQRFADVLTVIDDNAGFDNLGKEIWFGPPPEDDLGEHPDDDVEDRNDSDSEKDTKFVDPFETPKLGKA